MSMNQNENGSAHIGPARHPLRTLLYSLAVLFVVGLMGGTLAFWHQQDKVAAQRLEDFRAAYSRCDARFSATTAPLLRKLYLDSSRLQTVVKQELVALESGASCEQVHDALRSADFPLPPPVSAIPSATQYADGSRAVTQ